MVKRGQLYAFDEAGKPWVLDPATLETKGESDPYEATDMPGADQLQGAHQDRRRNRTLGAGR